MFEASSHIHALRAERGGGGKMGRGDSQVPQPRLCPCPQPLPAAPASLGPQGQAITG